MDPTEIIATPLEAPSVGFFTGISVLVLFAMSVKWWEPKQLLLETRNFILATLLTLFAMVLCGADPTENQVHTLWASLYAAALVWLSPPLTDASTTTVSDFQSALLTRLRWMSHRTPNEKLSFCRFYATLLVAVPFQILNILDWGAQIQRWPLPIILGCTFGWIAGSLFALLLLTLQPSSKIPS